MSSSSVEPPKEAAVLLRMAFAFVTSQVLYVAAELGIADHLAHGARARPREQNRRARRRVGAPSPDAGCFRHTQA